MPKGSSINDVKEEGGKGFCDDSSKALVIKQVTMGGDGGGGINNSPKLCGVIYGRPLNV